MRSSHELLRLFGTFSPPPPALSYGSTGPVTDPCVRSHDLSRLSGPESWCEHMAPSCKFTSSLKSQLSCPSGSVRPRVRSFLCAGAVRPMRRVHFERDSPHTDTDTDASTARITYGLRPTGGRDPKCGDSTHLFDVRFLTVLGSGGARDKRNKHSNRQTRSVVRC